MPLIICYGMTRSGSTLAFQVVSGILQINGFTQNKLNYPFLKEKKENFIPARIITSELLSEINQISGDNYLAIKTHGPLSNEALEYLDLNNIPVLISVRDPRDILLSLLEIGERNRSIGQKGFINISSFEDAFRALKKQIRDQMTWNTLLEKENTFLVIYEKIIFNYTPLVDFISNIIQRKPIDEKLLKKHLSNSFTQFNKGVPGRSIFLLSKKQKDLINTEALPLLNESINPYHQYKNSPIFSIPVFSIRLYIAKYLKILFKRKFYVFLLIDKPKALLKYTLKAIIRIIG